MTTTPPFYILALDGGGSLGVYTLGLLSEIERILPRPLHETFDLIYGTSTGSVIGSMIALGTCTTSISENYLDIVPRVMSKRLPRHRTAALEEWGQKIYRGAKFDAFLTSVGIVATHLEFNRPMIFKNHIGIAHGSKGSFEPGFGCSISDAVVASCAAFPLFRKKTVRTTNAGDRVVVDGGFCANNPTLFALTDALGPLGVASDSIRLLSLGTGSFPQRWRLSTSLIGAAVPTFRTLLQTSSNTVETLRGLLFPGIKTLRINDAWPDIQCRTDFMESDRNKLNSIYQRGRKSFEHHEGNIRSLFNIPGTV